MYEESQIRVKMLFPTPEIAEQYYVPLAYTAARTCYSEKLPQNIWDDVLNGKVADEKMRKLLQSVIESGHGTVIEHISFSFAISGVSRTLTHQLVRHRMGVSFDQQSQRYVKYKQPQYTVPTSISDDEELHGLFSEAIDGNMRLYDELLQRDVPAEDARFLFPNGVQTNLVMTVNLRQLIHMSGLRLCTMAQWEIRKLFALIKAEMRRTSPFLASFLVIKCVSLGYCDETRNQDEHCKVRPHKNTVFAVFNEHRNAQKVARPQGPTSGPADPGTPPTDSG
jgi:thymidylate synthase (FAD)